MDSGMDMKVPFENKTENKTENKKSNSFLIMKALAHTVPTIEIKERTYDYFFTEVDTLMDTLKNTLKTEIVKAQNKINSLKPEVMGIANRDDFKEASLMLKANYKKLIKHMKATENLQ